MMGHVYDGGAADPQDRRVRRERGDRVPDEGVSREGRPTRRVGDET